MYSISYTINTVELKLCSHIVLNLGLKKSISADTQNCKPCSQISAGVLGIQEIKQDKTISLDFFSGHQEKTAFGKSLNICSWIATATITTQTIPVSAFYVDCYCCCLSCFTLLDNVINPLHSFNPLQAINENLGNQNWKKALGLLLTNDRIIY